MAAPSTTNDRGSWNSKLGFILAAAGSAVGLGNIWGFPTQVASNGGGAFLLIYLLCSFLIGFPVMTAELTMGRKTGKNPFGAFKAIRPDSKFYPLIGLWGVICGVMILSFYTVVAGWAFSYVFAELFFFLEMPAASAWFADIGNGVLSAVLATLFMVATVGIITGGVSGGIERATKTLMPTLIGILIILIGYILFQPGAYEGIRTYLYPDFTSITPTLIFDAMGQAFFSLSLGMGALITYGSYLNKKENIPQAAAFVTLADVGIAFLAGFLIIPAMYMAQNAGVEIFNEAGQLLEEDTLVFQVLPELFHTIGMPVGLIFGVTFFFLLSIAALTSTISLLEVPVAFAIDEFGWRRKVAARVVGVGILAVSILVAFNQSLIGTFVTIFNGVGLPLGGFLICYFIAYVWKTDNALDEMELGYVNIRQSLFSKIWPLFIKIVCPLAILYVLIQKLVESFG